LRQGIETSKSRPLPRLINALGIRHIGERAAELLADRFGSLDALMAADLDAVAAVPGIGPVLAQSVYDFFQEPRNRVVIDKLRAAGVQMAMDGHEQIDRDGPLAGKTVVLTGRLTSMTRPEAEAALKRAGANVAGTVSKRTAIVFAGEDAGSKAERAQALGVTIMNERELLDLLGLGEPATRGTPQ
jgi:DNA ligase (NAD+)